MAWVFPERWDLARLARLWRRARPFPHVVIDGLVPAAEHAAMRKAFHWEQHYAHFDEIYSFLWSAEPIVQAPLRAFGQAFGGAEMRKAVGAISGSALARADMRGYVYLPGHYLLPHTDERREVGRKVAYAYYLDVVEPMRGGELELYACDRRGGRIARTRVARRIRPRPNRLVLFEVSPSSLHAVREVTSGARMSLAGWFYP